MQVLVSSIAVLAWVSLGYGCAAHPAQPSRPLGQPFELRTGASATVGDDLTVTFDRVRSDSRCPLDALCVQAGEAVIALTLSQSSSARAERELRTTPATSEASYQSFRVKLVALAPYPKSTEQIRPEDYVATLTVDRR